MTDKKSKKKFFISGNEKNGFHLIMEKNGSHYSIGNLSIEKHEVQQEISNRVEHGEVYEYINLTGNSELD